MGDNVLSWLSRRLFIPVIDEVASVLAAFAYCRDVTPIIEGLLLKQTNYCYLYLTFLQYIQTG
ncbi:MAG: hypothetical protein L0I28_08080, partial [Enterobacterales bacterium]|nr:hypothetical protein [Enterobacterales bacterium]